LVLAERIVAGQDFGAGRVKHVQAALLALLEGAEPDAADARAYLETLARRQIEAGADFLDCNVDEISENRATQQAAMRRLVEILDGLGPVPPSLDSSDAALIEAGLEASARPARLLLNSASVERLEVLDLAASAGCGVVVSAAGAGGLPADADERVANSERMVADAKARGLPERSLYVDPLVIPVAVNPEAGAQFLEAVARLRASLGTTIHLTGGLSTVSFGLPARRLHNDVVIDLATEAGADAGIIDPVASDLARIVARDRASHVYRLAADLVTGADPYGMAYLAAFRAGELAGEP
jgi:5-methyltetrahydrofolate--homocysteine methyltransferase